MNAPPFIHEHVIVRLWRAVPPGQRLNSIAWTFLYNYDRIRSYGGVSERFMVAVLKTAVSGHRDRGFESHPLRFLVTSKGCGSV